MKILFRFILGLMLILIFNSAFAERGVTVEEKIGDNGGSSLPHLQTAVNDAKEVKRVLTYTDTVTGMEFVLVKGGCYQMGDTFGDGYGNERPVHEVCLDDFYICKFKVTQGQWKAVRGNNPSYFKN